MLCYFKNCTTIEWREKKTVENRWRDIMLISGIISRLYAMSSWVIKRVFRQRLIELSEGTCMISIFTVLNQSQERKSIDFFIHIYTHNHSWDHDGAGTFWREKNIVRSQSFRSNYDEASHWCIGNWYQNMLIFLFLCNETTQKKKTLLEFIWRKLKIYIRMLFWDEVS